VFPDSKTVTVIALRHTDAKWAPPERRAGILPGRVGAAQDRQDVDDRISAIPTRLGLASACDRDLIYTAAYKLVAQYKDAILQFLNQP